MNDRDRSTRGTHTVSKFFSWLVLFSLAACNPTQSLVPVTAEKTAQPAGAPASLEQSSADANQNLSMLFRSKSTGGSVELVQFDLLSGKLVDGVKPIDMGADLNYAFSPDRTSLVVTSKGADCPKGCLRVFRLADLQQVAKIDLSGVSEISQWVDQMAFDPTGKRVALTHSGSAKLAVAAIDQDSSVMIQSADLAVHARLVAFTDDGTQIMLIGVAYPKNGPAELQTNPTLQAVLLDAQSLDVVWQQDLPGVKDGSYGPGEQVNFEDTTFYQAGMAVDSTSQRIYIAHADEDQLTTVDFKQRSVTKADVREKQTSLERVIEFFLTIGARPVQAKAANSSFREAVLSEDKHTLYVVGSRTTMVKQKNNEMKIDSTYAGMEAWDIASGTKLLHVETQADQLRHTPSGMLVLRGYDPNAPYYQPFTELFDPSTGQITAHLEDTSAYATIGANGLPLLVSSYSDERGKTYLSVIDEKTGKKSASWTQNGGDYFWPELH